MEAVQFPFSAICGMDTAKRAVVLQLVNPACGGVLISGASGTGKTILLKSIKNIVPDIKCVELPLGATEDMVFGSIDIERALATGQKAVRQGILHRASNSILFIDNINLMQKEFVHTVFECYKTGYYELQRDGISCVMEVALSPIGVMNPAEGILSSTELDCFGMFAMAETIQNREDRILLDSRLLNYFRSPEAFATEYIEQNKSLAEKIKTAKRLLPEVVPAEAIIILASMYAQKANCLGHHVEKYLVEAGRAIAALAGRKWLKPQDIEEAALYVLPHRMGKTQENNQQEKGEDSPQDNNSESEEDSEAGSNDTEGNGSSSDIDAEENHDGNHHQMLSAGMAMDRVFKALQNITMPHMKADDMLNTVIEGAGKHFKTLSDSRQGRYVRSAPRRNQPLDIALDATLRAAAPYQTLRRDISEQRAVIICPEDYQNKIREKKTGLNLLFLVDASGSMGAKERMRQVKGAILALLKEAYQKRDSVGLIAFRRKSAEVLLPLTRSVELAEKRLEELPTGGRTPLAEGLDTALKQLYGIERRHRGQRTVLIIVTDGRVNSTYEGDNPVVRATETARKLALSNADIVVIDSESGFVRLGIARDLAKTMGAAYYPLKAITRQSILHVVRRIKKRM